MRLRRTAAALVAVAALVGSALATAGPAAALSAVAYTTSTPADVWVGQTVTLGLDCPTTCPVGVTSASVSIAGGPTIALPAGPDYQVDWVVDGVTSGDPTPVAHVVTVSFTDETGSARTLTSTMNVHKDNPQYVEDLTPHDGLDASVSWTPPTIDGGAPVLDYKIQVDGSGTWATVGAGATTFSLVGYPYGPHTVRVIARNAIGWGWGDPVTVLVGVMPSAPVVSISGTAHPTLSWTESVGGGIAVTGYTVYAGGVPVLSVGPGVLSATLTALEPGPQDLTVAADCWLGAGDVSDPVAWVQPTVPSPVSTPDVVAAAGALTVSWLAPSDDGGLPVSSYAVRALDPATLTVMASTTTSGLTATLTPLLAQVPVLVQVAAVNELGSSGWSDAAAAVAPSGAAPLATTLTARVSSTSPTAAQRVVVSGVLTVPGRVETGEQVQIWVRPAGAATWTRLTTVAASSTGAWSYSRAFRTITAIQARYAGSTALGARPALSTAVAVYPTVVVSARTTTSTGAAATRFRLRSTLVAATATYAAPVGARASLQRLVGTRWVTLQTVAVVSGRAKPAWRPTARGTYVLRVVVGGSAEVRTGISRPMTVTFV